LTTNLKDQHGNKLTRKPVPSAFIKRFTDSDGGAKKLGQVRPFEFLPLSKHGEGRGGGKKN